jgi:HAD superfamily hydrolase (TIGR01509 family)
VLRTLLIDLLDVLLYDPYREALAAAGAGARALAPPAVRHEAWTRFEVAAIDEAEFVDRYTAGNPAAFDAAAFHRVRRGGYRWLPGMHDLLAGVPLETHVASNYPVWIRELRADFGLDDLVDGVWASCDLGVRKPDPAFFLRLLEHVGREPAACLFVDDRPENVAAAAALGLRAHVFRGAPDLVLRLRAEGVEVECNVRAHQGVPPRTPLPGEPR